ncbi:GNAT family N-acetyltransferase [Rhizobium sp. C4]|uniref:GNAT family N-acetyltransferase n=1 Tax=Rhizobium sp. C4 TaxID=1349800 RepID=UPI001E65476E|nr:GNAT family N-acetyltransferase [Rhizobium sp. C4]MCD2175621.1 GNAT family N-acetyltransferase [Rhizobium sp. C4]
MALFQTANLTVAPCTPNDREDFIALELDPDVMHFLNGGAVDHEATDPDAVDFLMPRGTEPFVWTARLKDSGEFVGWFCLSSADGRSAEIGYRLCKRNWGRGFASVGARVLVDWGFADVGYEMIAACTMAVNLGSRRVMEKLGMRHVRTVEVKSQFLPGADQGEVWYEMSRAEWRSIRKPSDRRV